MPHSLLLHTIAYAYFSKILGYAALLGNSRHARGALAMMANWDLAPLERALPAIRNPVLLIHSRGDNAIPLEGVEDAARALPDAKLEVLPGLGHLMHEERPEEVARLISEFLEEHTDSSSQGARPRGDPE